MRSSRLLVALALLISAQASAAPDVYRVPSDCVVPMFLPPINGTPQRDANQVLIRPGETETFRLRYGTTPAAMAELVPSSAGVEVTADTRHDFTMQPLSEDTAYHWVVECLEDGVWRWGWKGQVRTLPTTGDVILVGGGDDHWLSNWFDAQGGDPTKPLYHEVRRSLASYDLLSAVKDAHVWVDWGDSRFGHCGVCSESMLYQDELGRRLGTKSVTSMARTQAEEQQLAEVRNSFALRRQWKYLQNLAWIVIRGNHDVGGKYGSNAGNGGHWQWREWPWATTGVEITLGTGGELALDGTISETGHDLEEGEGPFRMTGATWDAGMTPPLVSGDGACGVTQFPDRFGGNEFWITFTGISDPENQFGLARTDVPGAPRCTFTTLGSGLATLVRGSDMRSAIAAADAGYLPNQNQVYPHGWGSEPESGIMGPIPLSDYAVFLHLDEYANSPTTCPEGPGVQTCFPIDRGIPEDGSGWDLGADQYAGALAVINSIGEPGPYEDVTILIIGMHHGLGGHMFTSGYRYGRGSLCELDTLCSQSGAECEARDGCGAGDRCREQDCAAPLAHPQMQALQDAAAAMVARTGGIAIIGLGHDHVLALGERAGTGVYWLSVGQMGGGFWADWIGSAKFRARYDFNGDGCPAFWRHTLNVLDPWAGSDQMQPVCAQRGLVESGSELHGYIRLRMQRDVGGHPRVTVDYKVVGEPSYPHLTGLSAPGFPLVIDGPGLP